MPSESTANCTKDLINCAHKSWIEQLVWEKYHYVILDESQNIKNVETQVTKAVDLLQSQHRQALSGTPIENNLTELYSLFRFLNPTMFDFPDDFNHEYTYPIQRDNNEDVMASLRRKIFPFMLRRLKKDVLTELPDRIEQTLYVEMGDEQKRFYEERRQYFNNVANSSIQRQGIEKSRHAISIY